MKKYAYIRVSTKEQNPERQMTAILESGVMKKDILVDKLSGVNFERPAYQKLLKKLKKRRFVSDKKY